MYEDSLKVENKIIDSAKLEEIFTMMNNEMERLSKEAMEEKRRNETIDYNFQIWNYRFFSSRLTFDVEFDDNSTISFDRFDNFISIYNTRLDEIKYISCYYSISYSTHRPGYQDDSISQHIGMYIRENKLQIDVKVSSSDNNVNEIYEKIRSMILLAPPKYDRTIKKKNLILNKVGFAIGFIPVLLIGVVLMFVPTAKEVFSKIFILFPMMAIFFAYAIGKLFSSILVGDYYNKLITDKKYSYYDSNKGKSVYEDDIDTYVSKCEVLIGKNINNMKYRAEIEKMEKKFTPFLLPEIIILVILSILVVVI